MRSVSCLYERDELVNTATFSLSLGQHLFEKNASIEVGERLDARGWCGGKRRGGKHRND
jgi:hypothetical protein